MKRKGFTLIELLVVISIIALLIGILLPALGAARRTARQMQSSTKVRGIHQSMFTYAQSNGEYMPGLTSKGKIADDGLADTPYDTALSGASVEHRYAALLDNDAFEGEYAISPVETKDVWTDEEEFITTANYSFAMLRIHDDGAAAAGGDSPNQGARSTVWKSDLDSETVLLSDRAKQATGGELYSIHSSEPEGTNATDDWRGTVGWADNHVGFETTQLLDTQYGSGPSIGSDSLFTQDDSSTATLSGSNTWNATYENQNALMDATEADSTDESTFMDGES